MLQRLRRKADIDRVIREGRRFHSSLAVLHVRRRAAAEDMADGLRMAVIANRKIGSAVARNRARRVLREASRVLLRGIPGGWDLLLVARAAALEEPYSVRVGTLTDLFRRAGVLREKAIASV